MDVHVLFRGVNMQAVDDRPMLNRKIACSYICRTLPAVTAID